MRKRKMKNNKLVIKPITDDHRGVFAASKINKDEKVLFVPKDLLITLKDARSTLIG